MQKKYGQVQRYDVDHGAKLILTQELINGFVQIDKYMKKNSFPRLPLPSICGYIPLVDKFASTLKQKSNIVIPNHDHNIYDYICYLNYLENKIKREKIIEERVWQSHVSNNYFFLPKDV